MEFTNEERNKIRFAYDLLNEINVNGKKFNSINSEGILLLSNGSDNQNINIHSFSIKHKENDNAISETSEMGQAGGMSLKYSETSEMGQVGGMSLKYSETSEMGQVGGMSLKYSETSEIGQNGGMSLKYSETSEMSEMPNKMIGGTKNIFKKMNYSETSSIKMSNVTNNSKTSSEMFNGRSDKYSETSIIGQIGGKNNETSETLMGISELKQRKTSKSNLDMGIFKKNQSGGSADNSVKKKMMDIGINSNSSTSSICE